MARYLRVLVMACMVLLVGCGWGSSSGNGNALVQPWLGVNDFLFQLQGFSLANAGASKFDLIVTDYSRDGDAASQWTPRQLKRLRNSAGGPKVLIAYMSIGEAEDYRFYWQPGWKLLNPAWLGAVDPDWPGNYRVEYWDPAWQAIIFGQTGAYLDRIIAHNLFTGLFLNVP